MRNLNTLLMVLVLLDAPAAILAEETAAAETEAAEAEEAAEETPEPPWKAKIGLSYLSTSGNTNTQSGGLDLKVERRPDPWGITLAAVFTRAEDSGVSTADRTFLALRGVRDLGERWQIFTGLSHERDPFAGIEQRGILEAGAIWKALTGPTHNLNLELGLNATHEDLVEPDPDSDYAGARAGLNYEWKLSETASLSQRLAYHSDFEDSANWRLDSLTSLSATLTNRLAVRVSYDLRHRNQPIGDNDDTDSETRVSLVLNL